MPILELAGCLVTSLTQGSVHVQLMMRLFALLLFTFALAQVTAGEAPSGPCVIQATCTHASRCAGLGGAAFCFVHGLLFTPDTSPDLMDGPAPRKVAGQATREVFGGSGCSPWNPAVSAKPNGAKWRSVSVRGFNLQTGQQVGRWRSGFSILASKDLTQRSRNPDAPQGPLRFEKRSVFLRS
jgi:hypothetical protein